ncbi:DUF6058 family natural product biosynthesis protein [Thalassotalea fusca]
MHLWKYLTHNFYTKEALLANTKISASELEQWQAQGLAPKASYKISMNVECDSFFGVHQAQESQEFYAKGYTSWLAIVQSNPNETACYANFYQRYLATLDRLSTAGHSTEKAELNECIDAHVKNEWGHFLNGIYGLCTKSGLPEDIAAKELAIAEISELLDYQEKDQQVFERLEKAVNLLDSASAEFAPHERARSSRFRLIDEVRREYGLAVPLA